MTRNFSRMIVPTVCAAFMLGLAFPVAADEPVHLIELEIEGDAADFDFGEITSGTEVSARASNEDNVHRRVRSQYLDGALELIGRGFPGHVENLVLWPDRFLRGFVAIQAPAHVQGMLLPG